MPDQPVRQSALAEVYRPGASGAERPDGPGLVLAERCSVALMHLAGRSGRAEFLESAKKALEVDLPLEPGRAAHGPDAVALPLAPERWLIESSDLWPEDLEQRLRSAVAHLGGAIADVSSAWAILRLSGPEVRRTLAKGCPVDLHLRAFAPGDLAQTSLEGVAVILHALPRAEAIDLYVARSFARHTFEWLLHAAAEFGARVDPDIAPTPPRPTPTR